MIERTGVALPETVTSARQAQLPDDRRQMPLDEMVRLQPATADSLPALNHSKWGWEQRVHLICGLQPNVGSDQDRNPDAVTIMGAGTEDFKQRSKSRRWKGCSE